MHDNLTDTPQDVERQLVAARRALQEFEESADHQRLLQRLRTASPAHPVLLFRFLFGAVGLLCGLAAFAVLVITQIPSLAVARALAKFEMVSPLPEEVPLLPTLLLLLASFMFIAWVTASLAARSLGRDAQMLPWEQKQHQKLVNEVTRITTQRAVMERIKNTPAGARPRIATPVPMGMRRALPTAAETYGVDSGLHARSGLGHSGRTVEPSIAAHTPANYGTSYTPPPSLSAPKAAPSLSPMAPSAGASAGLSRGTPGWGPPTTTPGRPPSLGDVRGLSTDPGAHRVPIDPVTRPVPAPPSLPPRGAPGSRPAASSAASPAPYTPPAPTPAPSQAPAPVPTPAVPTPAVNTPAAARWPAPVAAPTEARANTGSGIPRTAPGARPRTSGPTPAAAAAPQPDRPARTPIPTAGRGPVPSMAAAPSIAPTAVSGASTVAVREQPKVEAVVVAPVVVPAVTAPAVPPPRPSIAMPAAQPRNGASWDAGANKTPDSDRDPSDDETVVHEDEDGISTAVLVGLDAEEARAAVVEDDGLEDMDELAPTMVSAPGAGGDGILGRARIEGPKRQTPYGSAGRVRLPSPVALRVGPSQRPLGASTRGGTPLGAPPKAGVPVGQAEPRLAAPAGFPGTPVSTAERVAAPPAVSLFATPNGAGRVNGADEPQVEVAAVVLVEDDEPTRTPPRPAVAQDTYNDEEDEAEAPTQGPGSGGGIPRSVDLRRLPSLASGPSRPEPWLSDAMAKADALLRSLPANVTLVLSREPHLPFTLVITRATPAMAVRAMVSFVEFLAAVATPPRARIEIVGVAHLDRSFHRNVEAALEPYFGANLEVRPAPGQVDIRFTDPDPGWGAYPQLPLER